MSARAAVAIFDCPDKLTDATKKAVAKGYKNVDTYTPFPIHGMEDVLGLKPSIVPCNLIQMQMLLVSILLANHVQEICWLVRIIV